jgi:DNA mismatch repair protein MutL
LLPPEVIERIAAGEVIERPGSAVRELIDNALDAGATSVRVEMRNGGLRLVRVADDGWGIAAAELELACQRHTTSKVRTLADLEAVTTLGFRGEALASIATVAEVELASARDDGGLAATLTFAGGQPIAHGHASRSRGTTVSVRDLFAAVPARRALLRGPRTEAGHVLAVVRTYALAHPAVRFTLVSEGMLVLQTPGSDQRGAVEALYGTDVAAGLIPLDPALVDAAAVGGAVAVRAFSYRSREHVLLVVNGRPVANKALLAAAEAGYRPLLRKGRHPVLIARITVAPEGLDANVHPAKAEVLLRQEAAIGSALRQRIHGALGSAPLSAAVATTRPTAPYFSRPLQLHLPAPRNRRGLPLAEGRLPYAAGLGDENDAPHERTLPALAPLAQLDGTLILARSPQGHLYLVDQHRAHERVLYERLARRRGDGLAVETATLRSGGVPQQSPPARAGESDPREFHPSLRHSPPASGEEPGERWVRGGGEVSQMLLEPLLIELSPLQADLLLPRLAELRALGLECQPFGGSVFLVRAVPNIPGSRTSPAAFAEALAQEAAEDSDDWLDAVCISLACRSAVRRGEALTLLEQQALLADLRTVTTTAVCPHGSPLLLRYTRAALARAFEW